MALILFSFHIKEVGVGGLSQTALSADQDGLKSIMSSLGASEGFCLSTCNRNEYLFFVDGDEPNFHSVLFSLKPRIKTNQDQIFKHLLSVALSKDSVVFGESQILGQFKRAYEKGLEDGCVGTELSPILNRVIREAKQIRTKFGLTQIHTSVSTVAGAKLIQRLGRTTGTILFVGSGETNTILAAYLKKRGNFQFVWSSRGHQRAVQAAAEYGGEVLNWDSVNKGLLPNADTICVATHSKDILVDEVGLLNANPQIVCDLAVPANASAGACEKLGIEYFGIDQMNSELDRSRTVSAELLSQLEADIAASSQKIASELEAREVKHLIMKMKSETQRVWEEELQTLLSGKLSTLDEAQKSAIKEWSRRLVGKINHTQIESIKNHDL